MTTRRRTNPLQRLVAYVDAETLDLIARRVEATGSTPGAVISAAITGKPVERNAPAFAPTTKPIQVAHEWGPGPGSKQQCSLCGAWRGTPKGDKPCTGPK